jgi:hypothetical protein
LKLAIWATREKRFHQDYKLFIKRVTELINKNGFNFAFKYLKECLRLVTLYLAGNPQTTKAQKAIGVRVNQYGLPVIIPPSIRKELSFDTVESRFTTRCIITLISIFRVFPTKIKPDLGTITSPFSGSSRILDENQISVLVKRFCKGYKVKFGPIKGFISESAGPIAKKATWGSGIDALALLLYPKQAFRVLQILVTQRAKGYAISLLLIWLLVGPTYVLMYVLGLKSALPIGRLSVVYDQAGKARIVAMANWWIQLVLRPLHKSIFDVLESKETDGTFNQDAPLSRLMKAPLENHKFSCFDLSAATDRLPVDLQVQILNSLNLDGDAWKDLFDYPWYYKNEGVKYEVGQPMGAYSSWAMLALTHHIVVLLAAELAGVKNFTSYALLGDDIVINHDEVAEKYVHLMSTLGVSINMTKSIVSNVLCEFAKRLVTPNFEVSPIGAGNLLLVSRKTIMIGALLAELYNKSIIVDSKTVVELLNSFPRKAELNFLVLWTYFGSCRHLYSARLTSTFMDVWNTYGGSQLIMFSYGYHLFSGLRTTLYDDVVYEAPKKASDEEFNFWLKFYKISAVKGWSNRLLQSLTLVLAPCLYLYALGLLRATESAKTQSLEFQEGRFRPDQPEVLLDYSEFNTLSVKWSKKTARRYGQFVNKLHNNIEQLTRDESYD